ncbi:MAG: peptidoglycan-associated lipoprotein [Pseudobdellovibrio sp.]|jgi:peptidoglycan-associated lipoprotein|nr:peptidoglycan-associated lipoprotein [Pseudobdellovibrio sp.]
MKKILLSVMVFALVSGCSSAKKNETPTSNEQTGSGSTEKVESSAMDFSPKGSDSGSIEGLQTVRFEYDKATLTDDEQKKLNANAEWMKKNADTKMLIEGHCDQRGSIEYNLSLGERRANSVKQMLQKMGIPADRLTTTSYGKEKLLATGDAEEEMAQNRRANFVPSKK